MSKFNDKFLISFFHFDVELDTICGIIAGVWHIFLNRKHITLIFFFAGNKIDRRKECSFVSIRTEDLSNDRNIITNRIYDNS